MNKNLILTLQPGHIIDTLVKEHKMILDFLDKLEQINKSIQKMKSYHPKREEFEKLKHIAHYLVEAESHHQREEKVLFPKVEERGLLGPPQVMRTEHEQLRSKKKALAQLAGKTGSLKFDEFKGQLNDLVDFIVSMLRDHIDKENNILYPASLKVIKQAQVWQKMKKEADKIGYCCFAPQKEESSDDCPLCQVSPETINQLTKSD